MRLVSSLGFCAALHFIYFCYTLEGGGSIMLPALYTLSSVRF